ncbi:MAG TPA: ADP-ribosylglycohydrolase family protein [Pirellulales bacterium]|nr:ADP-ribosylglycohydrolase family protein [Pirellulales bacterium]
MQRHIVYSAIVWLLAVVTAAVAAPTEEGPLVMSRAEYEGRVQAAWLGQIIGVLATFPYEHQVSSVLPVTALPKPYEAAILDDDWYYEMVALRGFETHGIEMTIGQLGQMWRKHNCGTWGSSRQARLAMESGVPPAEAGLPQNNPLWFTIGPMFSCELYGLLAPGDPNLAGQLARALGRINGHAEGLDAGIFSAGVVSAAFRESDSRDVVRQATLLIHPDSPMWQALEQVIRLAEAGKSFAEVCGAVEDRWHIEYPATNNAVANAAIMATCIWFGEGDFGKSLNLAASAGDFVDADNIAATSCAVVGAMKGMQALPEAIVAQLHDRIAGTAVGGLKATPPVDESISALARRTAAVGAKMLAAHGAEVTDDTLSIPQCEVTAPPLERFRLADFAQLWNPDWTLERAGFGGGDGGLRGIRGQTHLEGKVLATYPRDEVRGLVLRRVVTPPAGAALTFRAGVDPDRAWRLAVYVGNRRVFDKLIEAPEAKERQWQDVRVDLSEHAGQEVTLRLFQLVLDGNKTAGNAYWKDVQVK